MFPNLNMSGEPKVLFDRAKKSHKDMSFEESMECIEREYRSQQPVRKCEHCGVEGKYIANAFCETCWDENGKSETNYFCDKCAKEKESYTLRFCKKHQPKELPYTDAELDAHNEEVRKKHPPLTPEQYRQTFGNVGVKTKEAAIEGSDSDAVVDIKIKSLSFDTLGT